MRTLVILGMLSLSAMLPPPSWAQPAASPTLDALAREHRTPTAIARFLRREFRFVRDRDQFGVEDRWQSPEEFAARRRGDCEDYALLARELLRRNGVEADVLSLFGDDGYAHTVCVFRDEDGHYGVIGVRGLERTGATTLTALATRLHPTWTFGGLAELDGARGRFVQELTNPDPVTIIGAEPFGF
jgi:hypothetical protein